jgi:tetratricopeptide (TPR) repeat protein
MTSGARASLLRVALILPVVAALFGAPLEARAQPGDASGASVADRQEAARAVKRGLAALAEGDAERALSEYQRAQAIVPDANLPHLYAAEALGVLGRHHEAVESLERYLALKPDVSDAAEVRAKIIELRARYLEGVLVVSCAARTRIVIDGVERGQAPTELSGIAPGPRELELETPGGGKLAARVVVSPGARVVAPCPEERRAAPAEPPPAPAAPVSAAAAADAGRAPSDRRLWGWIALCAGGALAATGLILDGTLLASTRAEFDGARRRGDPNAADLKQRGNREQAIVVGLVAAGVVSSLSGAVLLVGPAAEAQSGGLGVSISGSF